MSLDRPQEALLELEKVRSAAPREASVHFNMGKVLKRLGQPEKAMRCFLTALDLDPKDNNLIKVSLLLVVQYLVKDTLIICCKLHTLFLHRLLWIDWMKRIW